MPMFEMFRALSDKVENMLKIGKYSNVKGADGQLQEIQIKTLRNLEDAVKLGQFGFNSKAPIRSRCIVAKLGNENIIIANEHLTSIIDVATGDTIIYNETGTYIKLVGDSIEISGTKVTIDADLEVTGTTTTADIESSGDVTASGISLVNHTHTQPNDSNGDTQSPTNAPTP